MKKILNHAGLLASATLLALATSSCADEELVGVAKILVIEPYEEVEGTYASTSMDPDLRVNLGEVPVYGVKKALFKVTNPSTVTIRINSIEYDTESVGEDELPLTTGDLWGTPTYRRSLTDTSSYTLPFDVAPGDEKLIEIPYAPSLEGPARAKAVVNSTSSTPFISLFVDAEGKYYGQPDIEVEYNGIVSPSDPESYCAGGDCTMTQAVDFGNIGLTAEGTARIVLRNTATCLPIPGGDACASCNLQIRSADTSLPGLRFKEGTNDDGFFSFVGSTPDAFDIPQSDVECNQSGEVRVIVNFSAPDTEGLFETTLVVESNDPDEANIEIPIRAFARNSPVAVGEVRLCDPVTGVLNECSYEDEIEPLNRVFLTGENSYDPSGGTIVAYRWEVIQSPQGVNPSDYDWAGQNSQRASFFIQIAGEYVIRLTVTNDSGLESGDTETARVVIRAIPSELLHVQLVWDHPSNDQDLHLVHVSEGGKYCSSNLDCYFANCKLSYNNVQWFATHQPGLGPNPSLDRDDTNGIGPENINIEEPMPGTYRTFVHYYPGFGGSAAPTQNTLRIYLNGTLAFEESRVLTAQEQVWAVADVTWYADPNGGPGYGQVTPYPSPTPNQIGAIAIRDGSSCSGDGWDFPN